MIPARHILTGLFLIVFGAFVAADPHPSQYGIPVPREAGIVVICAGTILILYSLVRRKRIFEAEESERLVICPRFEETTYAKDAPDLQCLKCKVDLENLVGFYDRHPELKLKSKNKT